MNEDRLEQGEELYRNPRNTASGSLKLQDSYEVAKRPLDCLLYHVVANKLPFESHYDTLKKASKVGFKVPAAFEVCKNIKEVKKFIDHWDQARHDLPYETDGIGR